MDENHVCPEEGDIGNLKLLGEILEDARNEKGYSQRQVAIYADVSNTEISRLEKGQRQKPSPKILKKLADILDLGYEYLLEYAGYLNLENNDNSVSSINAKTLSEDEKNFIVEYIYNKWKSEAPKEIKFSRETVRRELFVDVSNNLDNNNQIDDVLNEAMIGMSKEEYEKLSETQKKQIRDFALFVKKQSEENKNGE